MIHLVAPVRKMPLVIPNKLKENYETAYHRCMDWKIKTFDDHMLLLEFIIGFLHSKLKYIEDKYQANLKEHYKKKSYLGR